MPYANVKQLKIAMRSSQASRNFPSPFFQRNAAQSSHCILTSLSYQMLCAVHGKDSYSVDRRGYI
ncbi:hypothetical protein SERLADRAFT_463697, partial [Serpula lacrymans var. lacrymans S7.9]